MAAPTDNWDPTQYERFAVERSQPFHDLVGLVERDWPPPPAGSPQVGLRVVDLGCGTGALTASLRATLGASQVLGLDNSAAMLAAAAPHAGPGVAFGPAEIGNWTDAPQWDVVLANASLQWVPDHPTVLARWTAALAAGGQLAVQVPANDDHPSHRIAAELAAEPEWAPDFAGAPGGHPPADTVAANVLTPVGYAELLHALGYPRQHVRLQVYTHLLADSAAVVEWTKGTTLTRFAPYLTGERHERFLAEYRRRVVAALGDARPYLYPFKRILLWGRRPA